MKDLMLLEITNAIRSRRLISIIISLLIICIVSFSAYILLEGNDLIQSIDFLFALNSQILFPVIFSSFIIASFISDFTHGKAYLINLSTIKKDKIFISKILVNVVLILISIVVIVNLYLTFSFIFHNQSYAFIGFLKFNIFEVFLRTNIILACTFFYILGFCLLGLIVSLIIPKFSVAILFIILISISHTIFPLPVYLSKYLFLSSYNTYSAIQFIDFPLFRILEATLINIISTIILLGVSTFVYVKKFSIRNV